MCKFFSAIITEDGSIYYSYEHDNHQKIIDANQSLLPDNKETIKFIRVEANPTKSILTEIENTSFPIHVDEATTPEWYLRNTIFYDTIIHEAIKKRQDHIWNEMRNRFCSKDIEGLLQYIDNNRGFDDIIEENMPMFKEQLEDQINENCGSYDEGHLEGYNEGFDEGKEEGRSEMYDKCLEAIKNL